jgi:long-chain acyl-CoA synthetase
MNLAARISQQAAVDPGRAALRFEHRTWSYQEVDTSIDEIASGLQAAGIAAGGRVAVMLPNWPEFHFCSNAAWRVGAIYIPVNVMLRPAEVGHILGDSGATVVFASPETAAAVSEASAAVPQDVTVVVVGGEGPAGSIPFQAFVARGEDWHGSLSGPSDEDELAAIAYTSGTTGLPKGAMLSHRNIGSSIKVLQDYLGLTADDDVLQVLPCFHSNASIIGVLFAWYMGSAAILVERFELAAFVGAVERWRPAFFAGVPTLLYDLATLPEDSAPDFSSVRYVTFGAASTPPHVRKAVEGRFGLRMRQAYGMTEAPNVLTVDPLEKDIDYDGVGKPLPHISLRIIGSDGQEVEPGGVGEVCAGPNPAVPPDRRYEPMKGYWGDPQATREALDGGWFHTGDLGRLGADGTLYLVDRMKDMIIRGGNNIFPAELERVLLSDPRVEEAYVVGIPHERLGEVPKAFVVLKQGATASAEELRELIREQLAVFKRLEAIEFIARDDLPRSPLGKVLKRKLRSA